MFIVEKPIESMEIKKSQVELLFEKFSTKGLYFKNSAILAAFFHSKENAIVIDVGGHNTNVSAVIEGFTENKCNIKSHPTFSLWRRKFN